LAEICGVGEDDGEHLLLLAVDGEDRFVEVRGNGDVVGADGFRGAGEERSGNDVERIGVDGETSDCVFQLTPAAEIEGRLLGRCVGEKKCFPRVGNVACGDKVAAVESAVRVVGVGGARELERVIGAEMRGAGSGGNLKLCGGEFVRGPGRYFVRGVVADGEGFVHDEFVIGGLAGGQPVAIGLSGKDGEEGDE